MSNNLPARRRIIDVERSGRMPVASRIRRWAGSPVGNAVAELAPDVIRYFGRNGIRRNSANVAPPSAPSRTSGMNVSEIEIDLSVPFIRKLTFRSSNAWTIAPDLAETANEEKSSKKGRFGLGLLSVAGIALIGFFATRRNTPSILNVPSRVRTEHNS